MLQIYNSDECHKKPATSACAVAFAGQGNTFPESVIKTSPPLLNVFA
jgi:hypothetical protein